MHRPTRLSVFPTVTGPHPFPEMVREFHRVILDAADNMGWGLRARRVPRSEVDRRVAGRAGQLLAAGLILASLALTARITRGTAHAPAGESV